MLEEVRIVWWLIPFILDFYVLQFVPRNDAVHDKSLNCIAKIKVLHSALNKVSIGWKFFFETAARNGSDGIHPGAIMYSTIFSVVFASMGSKFPCSSRWWVEAPGHPLYDDFQLSFHVRDRTESQFYVSEVHVQAFINVSWNLGFRGILIKHTRDLSRSVLALNWYLLFLRWVKVFLEGRPFGLILSELSWNLRTTFDLRRNPLLPLEDALRLKFENKQLISQKKILHHHIFMILWIYCISLSLSLSSFLYSEHKIFTFLNYLFSYF